MNSTNEIVENLRHGLKDAQAFRMVASGFSIYGFDLLKDELSQIKDVRFLFSANSHSESPDNVDSFELTESDISPEHMLQQQALARECEKWVARRGVKIRATAQSGSPQVYVADSKEYGTGVVGSPDFTRKGLGEENGFRGIITLPINDLDQLSILRNQFDDLWNDANLTKDIKRKIISALKRFGKDYSPELIYYKTLHELFSEEIDAQQIREQQLSDIRLYDTQIWKVLYQFQKDGVKSIISRLLQYNGCILADSVGLGKTYTALAVIKFFELRNERVLVLCPKKLNGNWSLYPAYNNHKQNPFDKDRFGYNLLSHTDLSREKGSEGSIDLANFNWENFDLIVIDESHNFRNHEGQRYERLLNEVIKEGTRTKVLMLSATPVNTSLIDLRSQIHLMTEKREEAFRESMGIGNIDTLLGAAQIEFKRWEETELPANGSRSKAELLEKLGPDFFKLLGGVSISRSRRQIQTFYSQEMQSIGKFPERESPENIYPETDLQAELNYKTLADQIEQFALSIYRPSAYVTNPEVLRRLEEEKAKFHFNQIDREGFLIGMIRVNFLKRLESSAHSLTLTLKRTIDKIDTMLEKIARYQQTMSPSDELTSRNTTPEEDEDDEEFLINRARHPYNLADLNLAKWESDLLKDRKVLQEACDSVSRITPQRDGKLLEIKHYIKTRSESPTFDRNGKENRKLLVFTTFKDTAQYLYDNLEDLTNELNLTIAMVSGDTTHTTSGYNTFNDILTNFAPYARNRNSNESDHEIDILIATDCISEGQNLHDCDTVINYDIHWNPVRIIQRFGRIDRIGSQNNSVRMINYWPTKEMDDYLHLKTRVQARMALADATASGDENLLDQQQEQDFQMELSFRDEQLKHLINNIPDLDEFNDGVVMSDFTLDYFFSQLSQYLIDYKDEIDEIPHGAHALTYSTSTEIQPGIIWVLKQRNASEDNKLKTASPVHPFYLIYVLDNGDIRHSTASTRQILDLFEKATSNQSDPINELCNRSESENANIGDNTDCKELLGKAVSHIQQGHNETQIENLSRTGNRDFKLTPASRTPSNAEDFELVTWLVIKPYKT